MVFMASLLNTLIPRIHIGFVSFVNKDTNLCFEYPNEYYNYFLLGFVAVIIVDGFMAKLK